MKIKKQQKKQRGRALRDRAEKAMGEDLADMRDVPVGEFPKLIHELRVHQVELELQNEELRQSQDALALSRDKYLELYDFAPVGYFTLDGKGLILEANLTGARLLGLERALLIRTRFSRFIAPDFQDRYYFHQKQALASGKKQVCELLLLPAGGVGFYAQLHTMAGVVDQSIDRLRIAVMDITTRVVLEEELRAANKELEEQVAARTSELFNKNQVLQEEIARRGMVEEVLRESETQYRVVVENAHEGIVVTQDAKICFANSRFEEISGYSKSELSHMSITDLFHPDDAAMVLEHHRQALAGNEEPLPFTARIVDKAGKTRWLRNKRVLIEWNNRRAILGFLDDISARLGVEKALRESEEQLRNIFLESPIGIALYDHSGLLRNANKSYLNILGLDDEDQLKGTSLFDDPDLSGGTKEMLLAGYAIQEERVLDHAKITHRGELDPPRTGTLYLDVRITPLGLSLGDFVAGYMAQIQDITERKHAERSIHALSQQLITTQESERQMISRELHDRLGQEVSTLKIGFDTLRHEITDICPEFLEKATDLSNLMQKVITDIRDLAYELRPPGLDQIGFQRVISQFTEDFRKKTGIEVDLTMTGIEDVVLDFNAEINLYRLIQESLNNIQKHARAKRVSIKMVASHPNIILRIKDDGIGFDPKNRLLATIKEKRMGLRNMQERAILLGGKMTILSKQGSGTEIHVEVPCLGRKNA